MNRQGLGRTCVGVGLGVLGVLAFLGTSGSSVAAGNVMAFRGTDPYIGEITIFAGNFAPRGWAFCDGQILMINQNQALFSLLGTTYGGDGRTTFALPDLRGRVPLHAGFGAGLTPWRLGQKGGVETVTLSADQMPAHRHYVQAFPGDGASCNPVGRVPTLSPVPEYRRPTGDPSHILATNAVSSEGGGQAHENMQPFLGLHYIIALQGVYPSRAE